MRFDNYINEAQFRDIFKHKGRIVTTITDKVFAPYRKIKMEHRQQKKLGAVNKELILIGKTYVIAHPQIFKSKKTMDDTQMKKFLDYCAKEGADIIKGADIPEEAKKIMIPKLKKFYTKLVWDRIKKVV